MMRKKYYQGRLCESNVSYEYFCHPNLKLKLSSLGNQLADEGVQFDIKTAFVLVFHLGGIRISMYPSGRMLFKNLNVEKDAKKLFQKLLTILEKCPAFSEAEEVRL